MDNKTEGYKNKEDEPKISKKEKNNILKILKNAVLIVLVVFIFLFLNATIIFNIKVATKAILNISIEASMNNHESTDFYLLKYRYYSLKH